MKNGPPRVSQSVSQSVRSGTGKIFLNMISWHQKLLMDHTNHMGQSVWHMDPCSTLYSRFSEAMQFFQNLNFSEFVPSNGCNSFNFWARIMKFWILKVLKSYQNHSFLWFFYLLCEKSSYLAYRVEKSSNDKSHITATRPWIWPWNLDVVKKRDQMLF